MYVVFLFLSLCTTSLYAYKLSIIAMFRDEARYLKEWVAYHHLMGVEHFWLYDDYSKDNWQEVLQEYIDLGIVEVINWAERKSSNSEYGFVRQIPIYLDGIQKAIGLSKWVAIIDLDEFIVPMKDETIVECLDRHYPKNTQAIYINWRNFGTGGIMIPEGESLLYHLTACSLVTHSDNSVGKCIVRPEQIDLKKVWTPHHYDLLDDSPYYNGSAQLLPKTSNGEFDYSKPHAAKFLCVNHYVLRDEYFFWNFRYPRTVNKTLLMEHYYSFCLTKNKAIHRHLQKLYPKLAFQDLL